MIIKIHLTSGAVLFREEKSVQAFRAYINSANARGGNVITAYKNYDESTNTLTGEVQLVLNNVEYFEKL